MIPKGPYFHSSSNHGLEPWHGRNHVKEFNRKVTQSKNGQGYHDRYNNTHPEYIPEDALCCYTNNSEKGKCKVHILLPPDDLRLILSVVVEQHTLFHKTKNPNNYSSRNFFVSCISPLFNDHCSANHRLVVMHLHPHNRSEVVPDHSDLIVEVFCQWPSPAEEAVVPVDCLNMDCCIVTSNVGDFVSGNQCAVGFPSRNFFNLHNSRPEQIHVVTYHDQSSLLDLVFTCVEIYHVRD